MEQVSNEDVERVTWFGYQSLIFSLIRALTISIGSYIMFNISQVDTNISTIFGFIMSLIPFAIFISISKNRYNLDIIDLNIKLFGKVIGNILNFVLNIVFIFLGSMILYVISQYIDIQYIPNTSSLYVKLLIILPVIYAATKSISTITRISQIILFCNLTIFILSVIGLAPEFDFNNLLPIFDKDIKSILFSSLIFALSISSPLFLMTIIPQNKVVKKEYNSKKMLLFFAISCFTVIIIIVTTMLILGIDIINIYRYPIYLALRQFSLFTIIERVERFLSLQFLFDIIIYLILTFHFIAKSLNKLFKVNHKENIFSYIIGIIVLIISTYLFKDNVKTNKIIKNTYVYILSLGIILPMFITYIGVILDKLKNKLKS